MLTKELKIYIIGCPYSGTTYTAQYLKDKGFAIGHERLKSDGMVNWKWTNKEIEEPALIYHLVRNPVKTISSMSELFRRKTRKVEMIGKYSFDRNKSDLYNAMLFWRDWNKLAESRALQTIRVESLISKLSTTTNSKGSVKLPASKLQEEDPVLFDEILDMGRRYGYSEFS